jgi:ribosomal protein L37AE/L43A
MFNTWAARRGMDSRMVETCINCGERAVVFVIANKWRCKKCGKYFDWTQIRGAKK